MSFPKLPLSSIEAAESTFEALSFDFPQVSEENLFNLCRRLLSFYDKDEIPSMHFALSAHLLEQLFEGDGTPVLSVKINYLQVAIVGLSDSDS